MLSFRHAQFSSAAAIIAIAVLCACAGCQSYAPHPPDLEAHHAAWLERSLASEQLATFAQALHEAGALERTPSGNGGDRDALQMHEAELLALVFNADLRLARAAAGVSGAARDHAGLWDDPVLSVSLERMLAGGANPWMAMTSVGFTLPLSGRLELEKQLAGAQHHAALYSVVEQEWLVRSALRRAWIEWSAATLARDVTADFLEQLDRIVAIVARMEEVGELAEVQGRLFYIEQAQRRNELRSLESLAIERGLLLRQLLGLPPNAALELAPLVVLDQHDDPQDPAEIFRANHPRLRTLLAEHDAAERTLELAVRRQYPDVTIGPGYSYEDGTDRILLGVSLPIALFNRNRQQIAQATAMRHKALATVQIAYEQLAHEWAVASIQLDAANDQLERMQQTIIPLVDQQYAQARRIAELGEVDTLLLLDTLRRQYEAKRELINLQAKRSLAHVDRAELLGPREDDALARGSAKLIANQENAP